MYKRIVAGLNVSLVVSYWIPWLVVLISDFERKDSFRELNLLIIFLAANLLLAGIFGILGFLQRIKDRMIIGSFGVLAVKQLIDYILFDNWRFILFFFILGFFTIFCKFFSKWISYRNQILLMNLLAIIYTIIYYVFNGFPWNY